MTKLNFITACWWLFILYWTIFAFSAKPAKKRQSWGGQLFVVVFMTVTFLLLLGKIPWWGINERLWPYSRLLWFCGCGLTFGGLVVVLWARWTLGRNWSAHVTLREGHELVERGPYRLVRHPMYSGLLLMVLGTAVVLGNLSGLLAFLVCFLGHWWKLRQEEALLLTQFFDSYQSYRSRTKALVPFVF